MIFDKWITLHKIYYRISPYYPVDDPEILGFINVGLVRIVSTVRIESKEMNWFGPASTVELTEEGQELVRQMQNAAESVYKTYLFKRLDGVQKRINKIL